MVAMVTNFVVVCNHGCRGNGLVLTARCPTPCMCGTLGCPHILGCFYPWRYSPRPLSSNFVCFCAVFRLGFARPLCPRRRRRAAVLQEEER